MTVTVVELVESMHPVRAIIDSRVLYILETAAHIIIMQTHRQR